MWIIIIFVIVIVLGALLGGNSLGELIRLGCGFVLLIIIGLYLYNKCSSESIRNESTTPNCARCGGDGELSEAEWNDFLMSDILDDEKTIKTFQDWMDSHHPGWVRGENIHTSFGFTKVRGNGINNGYGSFGPLSRKAYVKYKRDCFTYNSDSPNTCVLCGN